MSRTQIKPKYTLFAIIALLVLLTPVVAFASDADISNAKYKITIGITNNGDAITNGVAVFDLSTADMITGGMLSDNATDCAMVTGTGGSNIVFMPSVDDEYPWVTWVDNIGKNFKIYRYLYSKGATGGKIRYFPGPTGMTTNDNNTNLEFGSNFKYEFRGYVNSSFNGSTTWTNPTGFIDFDNQWVYEENAYNDDTGTRAYDSVGAGEWTSYLTFTLSENTTIYAIRTWTGTAIALDQRSIDLWVEGDWLNIYEGANTDGSYQTTNLNGLFVTDRLRLKLKSAGASGNAELRDFDFGTWNVGVILNKPQAICVTTANNLVTANVTGVAAATGACLSGERKIEAYTASGNLTIEVDDNIVGTVSLGGSVPANGRKWQDGSPNGTPYMEYIKKWVGENLVQHIKWQYGSTFTDLSDGGNNNATPTFRITASDEDLSAEVESFSATYEPSVPVVSDTGGWLMIEIEEVPSSPKNLFTGGGYSFPLGSQVAAVADKANQPRKVWLYGFAFAIAIIAFIFTYSTTHKAKIGQRGSLLLACLASEIVLIFFYIVGTVPGFVLIPFGLIFLLLVMWRRSPSPID